MPAYRCAVCNINYPPHVGFRVCPNCDDVLSYFTNMLPDNNWQKHLEERRAGINMPPKKEAEPTDAATVIYRDDIDAVLVSNDDLERLGYEPAAFDIVKLNGKYYELWERAPGDMWTINGIDVYAELTKLDEWSGEPFEGPSSDDIRQVELEDGTRVYWDGRTLDGP